MTLEDVIAALTSEWEATKQPVKQRASVLPFATYDDGTAHLAVPAVIASIFEGAGKGAAMSGHDVMADPMMAIPAAVDVAGGAMTGGFAATAAGAGERGALMANGLAKDAANVPAQKGFTAYHGSPHDFDKFDMSKIGTGEGAQAYGHGLYFAENEGVARSYRNNLSAPPGQFDWMSMGNSKKYRFEALPGDGTPKFLDNNAISDFLSDPQYLKDIHNVSKFGVDSLRNDIAELERKRDAAMASAPEQYKAYYAEDYGRRIENKKRDLARGEGQAAELDALVRGGTKLKQGRMYEVRINADPNDFLDWDKPFSQQSESIKSIIAKLPHDDNSQKIAELEARLASGDFVDQHAARQLILRLKSSEAAGGLASRLKTGEGEVEHKLLDAGIPGIKYLDQGSRTAGDGSRNYVLFRDDIIDIVKKYGVAFAAAMYGEQAVNAAMDAGGEE